MPVECQSLSVGVLSYLYETTEAHKPSPVLKYGCKTLIDKLYSELPFDIEFVDFEPYHDANQMKISVKNTGVLQISTLNNESQ